jgi:hypothetical protein
VAVAKISEANIYHADKDRDREIEVTDSIYDHQLDTDIDRRKKIISSQSDYDLSRHSYE